MRSLLGEGILRKLMPERASETDHARRAAKLCISMSAWCGRGLELRKREEPE